jgi:carbon storage regulator
MLVLSYRNVNLICYRGFPDLRHRIAQGFHLEEGLAQWVAQAFQPARLYEDGPQTQAGKPAPLLISQHPSSWTGCKRKDLHLDGGLANFTVEECLDMLILTRKAGETIRIGDDVAVSVIEIRGNQVRLGITAPMSVAVHRQEVYDQIQEQNVEAARVRPSDKALIQNLWQKRDAKTGQKPDPRGGQPAS